MKLIAITATERCDFTYYLGQILSQVSPRVIVIDNSHDHKLFNSVLGSTDESDEVVFETKRSNITYLKDVDYSPEFFEAFEYVIIYQGMNIDFDDIEKADYCLAMPNYEPENLEKAKDMPSNTEYILRDNAGKVTDKAAVQLLETTEDKVVGSIEHSTEDYANYLSFLYNGRQKIKGLSNSFTDALIYTVAKVTDGNKKNAVVAIKKARK